MSTIVKWRASSVTGKIVHRKTYHNGTILVSLPPTVDPIQDAVNNVRFSFACISHDTVDFAQCTLRTFHSFRFRPQVTGRLRVNLCAAPQGGVLVVSGETDRGDFSSLSIGATMRITVTDPLGNVPPR